MNRPGNVLAVHTRMLAVLVFCLLPSAFSAPPAPAQRLIDKLHMQRIPQEGPWYVVTYSSSDLIPGAALPARYGGKAHSAGGCIYLVETREDFSAMHRLQTDETWHFYGGDPIEMLLLYPDGHGENVVIGPDLFAGQHPQFTVPRGVWQGSIPHGSGPEAYSFAGDQLTPAFDNADFSIGYRDDLQKRYPAYADQIARLTRAEFATRPDASDLPVQPAAPDGASTVLSGNAFRSVEVAPGITLRELVGRKGPVQASSHSVAWFGLERGHATLTSHNKFSVETFLIISGHGELKLGDQTHAVGPGSVATMPAGTVHRLTAGADENLEFYAIEVPAYSPEDFVVDPDGQ